MCPYEQFEKLINDIKQAKEDIQTTDYSVLDAEQLTILANECMFLLVICNKTAKEIETI